MVKLAAIVGFLRTTTYTRGGPAILVDSDATVVDPDSSDFDGGRLTVQLTVNKQAGDRVAIRDGGAEGRVGVSGYTVTFDGVLIGTFTGGTGSTVLAITFNQNATRVPRRGRPG